MRQLPLESVSVMLQVKEEDSEHYISIALFWYWHGIVQIDISCVTFRVESKSNKHLLQSFNTHYPLDFLNLSSQQHYEAGISSILQMRKLEIGMYIIHRPWSLRWLNWISSQAVIEVVMWHSSMKQVLSAAEMEGGEWSKCRMLISTLQCPAVLLAEVS